MRKISILIAALTLSISLKPLAAQNKKVFIIDKQTVYQEIDNFSASDAWRCAFIGKNWPQEKKEKIADLLFKREFDEKGTLKKYSPFRQDNPSFPKSLARSGRHSGEVNGPAPTNSRGRRPPHGKPR